MPVPQAVANGLITINGPWRFILLSTFSTIQHPLNNLVLRVPKLTLCMVHLWLAINQPPEHRQVSIWPIWYTYQVPILLSFQCAVLSKRCLKLS